MESSESPNPLRNFVVLLCSAVSLIAWADVVRASSYDLEGASHGFPALYALSGENLADGEFFQWLEDGRLHVRIEYDFGHQRRIEEKAIFRQDPTLVQENWSWREKKGGELIRAFDVDFQSGRATAQKGAARHYDEKLKVIPGRTFAGFGFALAIKSVRERLVSGEKVELHAVAFTPKPRIVSVKLAFGARDQLPMAGRIISGDRFIIHPEIPSIAKLFVNAEDTRIWLTTPKPAGFLRWEGAMVEPDDPVVRVDLLPGNKSVPARESAVSK